MMTIGNIQIQVNVYTHLPRFLRQREDENRRAALLACARVSVKHTDRFWRHR